MTNGPQQTPTSRSVLRAIPRSIWALGFVSLFMDMSSELIHSLLPVFMVSLLGASALVVGLVEGIAEATASLTKVFSGALSDTLGKRKRLTVIGYGMAAATKPLFPLAGSVGTVLTARVLDRIGKGIRGAPRDALVADIAPAGLRGASYGLRQALDSTGAFAGPVLAILLMAWLANDIRKVFWIAAIPAAVALAILVLGVEEPESAPSESRAPTPVRVADLRRFDPAYWWLLLFAVALTLARFSEAFLVLRADTTGLRTALLPIVFVAMNAVYAVSAYPAGGLSDRIGRHGILVVGCLALTAAHVVLGLATQPWVVMAGVSLWGLHLGLTQGLLAAMVADMAPTRLEGTAFGVFNLATGGALLVGSAIAGWIWDRYGPPATFFTAAGITLVALTGLLRVDRPKKRR